MMISGCHNKKLESLSCAVFALVFLAFVFFYATRPISDTDFWWHLKTGEIMMQNGGLLQFDPFAYTSDDVVTTRETIILKGYWLWQITASGLFSLLGFNGIFLLNLLTGLAMVGVVAQQMRSRGVGVALSVLLLTLGFFLFHTSYALERPQVVSFLGAAILLGLLSRLKTGGWVGRSLPLLMVIWANVHGGFVVGDIILICYAAGLIIESRKDLSRIREDIKWIVFAIIASLLNPNGALPFAEVARFYNSNLMFDVNEYRSTWRIFNDESRYVAILWFLIFLYFSAVAYSRKIYWPEFIVAIFVAFFSFSHQRNIGFFAVAMLPIIGSSLQQVQCIAPRFQRPIATYLVAVVAVVVLAWQATTDWQWKQSGGVVSRAYPEKAVRFILSSGLGGKMFNNYTFGGYLLWQLYPHHQVFIDGRGMDPEVYKDWKLISAASLKSIGGRKEYEVLLDHYGVDFVIQPLMLYDTGRLTPLLKFLVIKPEWFPVYLGDDGYVIVKNTNKNRRVIEKYGIDKQRFINSTVAQLMGVSKSRPDDVVSLVALSEMLIYVGLYPEATNVLASIAKLQPGNPELPSLYSQLKALGGEGK